MFNRNFAECAQRKYDGSNPDYAEPSMVPSEDFPRRENYKVFCIRVLTDTVLDSDSEFWDGFDGDTALFGDTLTPGDHFIPLKRAVFSSGTGYVHCV